MNTLIASFLGLLALALFLPVISDLVSIARRAVPRPRARKEPAARLLVLVPAHDEEALIGECVDSLQATGYPPDRLRIVVIADNCSDRTAAVVRSHGAECLERTDPVLRGKPRALEWAITHLPIEEYDAVIVIDADTVVRPGFFAELASFEDLRRRAVQANYGVRNATDNDITWLSWIFGEARYRYAFVVKDRVGLNVPLMGNGMCIGTDVLREHGWQAFSICEDWELYAQFTIWGIPIHVAPDACLLSQEARSRSQSRSQRERWAAGKIGVLGRYAGRLLSARSAGLHQKLDALGELIAPGPVVHLGIVLILQAAALLLEPAALLPIAALLWLGLGRQGLYAALAARRSGGLVRFLRALRSIPGYLVWRLGVQLGALRMVNSRAWIKTERN